MVRVNVTDNSRLNNYFSNLKHVSHTVHVLNHRKQHFLQDFNDHVCITACIFGWPEMYNVIGRVNLAFSCYFSMGFP